VALKVVTMADLRLKGLQGPEPTGRLSRREQSLIHRLSTEESPASLANRSSEVPPTRICPRSYGKSSQFSRKRES
jgi:hypothetical protein